MLGLRALVFALSLYLCLLIYSMNELRKWQDFTYKTYYTMFTVIALKSGFIIKIFFFLLLKLINYRLILINLCKLFCKFLKFGDFKRNILCFTPFIFSKLLTYSIHELKEL
jgi:hypothetical protein